ncbi:response regulator [Chitinimonas lacunae]|uniref:Response regulator n=1 Tax=Chitinimonas lacunae TaxID=1963018 RepID=A0ABV8MLJ4_9NEIS
MQSILLIDDSSTMLLSVRQTLEMSGYQVDTALDGQLAMGKLKSGYKPDLIITDINMPNMDGISFIRSARALPGFRFLPILALTTESQTSKRDEAKREGASGWLVKPIAGPDLLKVIRQVLPA